MKGKAVIIVTAKDIDSANIDDLIDSINEGIGNYKNEICPEEDITSYTDFQCKK